MTERSLHPATFEQAVKGLEALTNFMSVSQRSALRELINFSEEKQFFFDKIVELADLIERMHTTMEQDGLGDNAIVWLHYFAGGSANFYITEKDVEPGPQHQAFGYVNLGDEQCAELGYVSIQEITEHGGELDLHFTPVRLLEVKQDYKRRVGYYEAQGLSTSDAQAVVDAEIQEAERAHG